ncbi:MAG: periplasmic protein [Desulfobulbaceae bacterium]|nr:MAG: periplasmic protein [Desulfobulbaceae bacterium]
MKRHGRALGESLVLHGFLATVMVIMAGALTPPPKVFRLDFSLQQSVAAAPAENQQASSEESVASPPPVTQPEPRIAEVVPPPERLEPALTKIKHAPVPVKPVQEHVVEQGNPEVRTEAPVSAAPADSASAGMATVSENKQTPASIVEAYRQANYTAIRDSILGNLQYPMMARRRGWSGQVELAFTIGPDGQVHDLKILTSSGFPILDEQAMTAIRRSAPFRPPPPVVASLVMPVTFRLN